MKEENSTMKVNEDNTFGFQNNKIFFNGKLLLSFQKYINLRN